VFECGECGGPGKTGCDSTCGSALQLDCEGVCDGDATTDCNVDCRGNGILKYYCEDTDNDGLLNIESRSLNCIDASIPGNCDPNFDSCLFMDCDNHPMYTGTVINCQGELPSCQEDLCIKFQDYLGDDVCDFLDTNCEEFDYDGDDCNLVDCMETRFSDEFCFSMFGAGCTTTIDIVDSTMNTQDGSTIVEHGGLIEIDTAWTVTGISIPDGATVDIVINPFTFELSVAAVDGTNGGDSSNVKGLITMSTVAPSGIDIPVTVHAVSISIKPPCSTIVDPSCVFIVLSTISIVVVQPAPNILKQNSSEKRVSMQSTKLQSSPS
jgi:hypothetical protein